MVVGIMGGMVLFGFFKRINVIFGESGIYILVLGLDRLFGLLLLIL